ncbi:pseudouridine synthase, RluA family [Caldicellulosiruptor saccharolyticus DSM 8903]|uniref:Pseudouridine synthase n=1 Tax=Caldicellulosiruptor saccharolyticus (strain ATCC 43494 / DSM 8903 / Tp8T 6331) TaxID=351627 RepID=A4XKS8_CALS8|nr:RluA family pseudouridine synthase [Caldicellulosiruptor saccharolyticus]ABP67513.1 pseudouridine synthase, RluA family [Caldicellulosiruptor saccharolyticus DSM 8903]
MTVEGFDGRLDKYLSEALSKTRSFVQKIIEEGNVWVNQSQVLKPAYKVKSGDIIKVVIPEPKQLSLVAQDIDIEVVYEDEHLAVINKPRGMVVHPGAGNFENTLVNALLHKFSGRLSSINGVIRPGIVHRLDKDTSGLLIVAKTDEAHIKLSEALKSHQIKRIYYAICEGVLKEDSGVINAPIGRHPVNRLKMAVVPNGKEAVTYFEVLERFDKYTFIKLRLKTGRTHQIRVHMSYIGYPLLGDSSYGRAKNEFGVQGQVLHAGEIEFVHPITSKVLHFSADLPEYFLEILNILRNKNNK